MLGDRYSQCVAHFESDVFICIGLYDETEEELHGKPVAISS